MVEWKINSIKCKQEPNLNTVTELGYTVTFGDHVRSGYVPLEPPGQTFIEFSDLTEEVCLEWVWAKVSKEATEDALNKMVGESAVEAFPWQPQEE